MASVSGNFIVLATPFKEDGSIDFDGFGKNLDKYAETPVDGVIVAGALGEYLAMNVEERKELTAFAGKRLAGRIPFIVGTTAHDTKVVIELSNHAHEHGAVAVMILPSPGYGLMEDEIYTYYKDISDNVKISIMLYNNPGSSGVDMEFDLVKKIAALPNVNSIKEASGDIKRITRMRAELPESFSIFCGWEDMHHESFCAGATGWVCMGGNFAPGLTRDLLALVKKGEMQKALELTLVYNPIARHLENAGKVTQQAKYMMDKLGYVGGYVRAPKQALTDAEKAAIDALLATVKLY